MAEEEFTITVADKEYKLSDLGEEEQQIVAHLRDLDSQLAQVNFRFEQLNASKAFFSDRLVGSLSDNKSESADSDNEDKNSSTND